MRPFGAEKYFLIKSTFRRNHVAQMRKVCTNIIQLFPELARFGLRSGERNTVSLAAKALVFVQGGTGSEQHCDLEVTETDLTETFLGGRTVAKKKKAAAKKAPKKKAKKSKKKK